MENILKYELDSGKNSINLPIGEFKESIIIDRPCTITGNDTILWNENNPIIMVRSSGVVLKDIRLELTAISGYESDYAVLQLQPDTIVDNVEIFGGVADTKKFYIPRSIHLETFRANAENTFILKMYLPERCQVKVNSFNFSVSSYELNEGYVDLIIKTNPLEDKSMLYGEILLVSKLIRRIYVDGTSLYNAPQQIDKEIYSCRNIQSNIVSDVFAVSIPKVQSKSNVAGNKKLLPVRTIQRGERCIIENPNINIKLCYVQPDLSIDIDPYIFLTDENNNTQYDEDMVFFGNTYSRNSAVSIQKDNSILMELNKIPIDVQKISVCYSIYKATVVKNFSMFKNIHLSIFENNLELYKISLNDLGNLSTVIAVEFYRHNSLWKANPVASGYRGGLPRLCQSFGIDAEY